LLGLRVHWEICNKVIWGIQGCNVSLNHLQKHNPLLITWNRIVLSLLSAILAISSFLSSPSLPIWILSCFICIYHRISKRTKSFRFIRDPLLKKNPRIVESTLIAISRYQVVKPVKFQRQLQSLGFTLRCQITLYFFYFYMFGFHGKLYPGFIGIIGF
jgi:hypothetical protein